MKPIVAVTMGDPCGIGPEVIVKEFSKKELYAYCRPVITGNAKRMAEAASDFGRSLSIRPIRKLSEARFHPGTPEVLDETGETFSFRYGAPSPEAASAALKSVRAAADLALSGEIDAMATAPIHKEEMKRIGFAFPGHTEFLADLAKTGRVGMMMVGGGLKIMLATIHLPLKEAIAQTRKEALIESIRLTHRGLERDFGTAHPRIALAALNPHAGERGIFGDEEKNELLPAVASGRAEGIDVSGPYPADTLFYQLKQGRFDAAIALFHDQALIPIKLLAFGNAVNVTIGLPFIRTSVDHGTAYDIAGKGVADPGSLKQAIFLAAQMANHRMKTK